jgi:DNA-binding response OmpR family regulator
MIIGAGADGDDASGDAVKALGYECLLSADPISAIELLEIEPGIGVVIADASLVFANDFNILEEIDARFGLVRPVVPIIMADGPSLDIAVRAMNANAVDLLSKPLSDAELARALRRAFLRRSQLVSIKLLTAFASAQSIDEREKDKEGVNALDASPDQKLIKLIRRAKAFRQRRNEFLGNELFSDPAWDIILELTLAKLQGEPVPVSSACAAAAVPFTTAYRCIGNLVDHRMVRRWKDPLDNRRVLLELENDTHSAMSEIMLASDIFTRPLED